MEQGELDESPMDQVSPELRLEADDSHFTLEEEDDEEERRTSEEEEEEENRKESPDR